MKIIKSSGLYDWLKYPKAGKIPFDRIHLQDNRMANNTYIASECMIAALRIFYKKFVLLEIETVGFFVYAEVNIVSL